jgi:DNA polymerase-1
MWLSQDPVGMEEIRSGFDMHQDNMEKFGLPSRLIAKVLVFRILYGGTEHGFVKDPDFMGVSTSKAFWKEKIDLFYQKYKGVHAWHTQLVQGVVETGFYTSPFGRTYQFKRLPSKFNGDLDWPFTQIKNFPVQGLGADIVSLLRVVLYRRLKKSHSNALLINTIHDSIVLDTEEKVWYTTCELIDEVCADLPAIISKQYGVDFNLPIRVETQVGPNLRDMRLYQEK